MLLFKFLIFVVVGVFSFISNNFDFDELRLDFSNYVDSAIFKYGNNDIVGNLVIKSLEIDTPIVRGMDNFYYLNYDEYKNKNASGAIFIDYRNNIDIDRKVLIYGHNVDDFNGGFKKLEEYLSFDFFSDDDNRLVKINSRNKEMIYEVSSVLIVDKDFSHIDLSFSDDEWNKHVDWINNNSIYDKKINYSDQIVVMQTCYHNPENSFLLVVLKKINESYH